MLKWSRACGLWKRTQHSIQWHGQYVHCTQLTCFMNENGPRVIDLFCCGRLCIMLSAKQIRSYTEQVHAAWLGILFMAMAPMLICRGMRALFFGEQKMCGTQCLAFYSITSRIMHSNVYTQGFFRCGNVISKNLDDNNKQHVMVSVYKFENEPQTTQMMMMCEANLSQWFWLMMRSSLSNELNWWWENGNEWPESRMFFCNPFCTIVDVCINRLKSFEFQLDVSVN